MAALLGSTETQFGSTANKPGLLSQILTAVQEFIRLKEIHMLEPYAITATTSPKMVLDSVKHKNVQTFYVVFTDAGTLTAVDYVLVGKGDNMYLPLYSIGDMFSVDMPAGYKCDVSDLYVKTTGGTATVVVGGTYYGS